MTEALALADETAAAEVPIGAVVVVAGQIVGRGMNRVIRDGDDGARRNSRAARNLPPDQSQLPRARRYRVHHRRALRDVCRCAAACAR